MSTGLEMKSAYVKKRLRDRNQNYIPFIHQIAEKKEFL